MPALDDFIQAIPKAELHLHIEGSFEPELMFQIARRNNVAIPFDTVEDLRAAYNFKNLQEFLDLYYAGTSALLREQDFYDLTWAYLTRIHADNVIHTEIMFDPQAHTARGVAFKDVIGGIHRALKQAEAELGISHRLIMSFMRHLPEGDAFATLEAALPYRDLITAIGLDSSENGFPPKLFARVYARARQEGFRLTMHAGEEGPADYVRQALDLGVDRIDHGNRSLEDDAVVADLVAQQIPLTVCPLSNLKLCGVASMDQHPIRTMLDRGLMVTVNSDDPAYFGGYMVDNFKAITHALDLSHSEIVRLVRNGFLAAWVPLATKARMLARLDQFLARASGGTA